MNASVFKYFANQEETMARRERPGSSGPFYRLMRLLRWLELTRRSYYFTCRSAVERLRGRRRDSLAWQAMRQIAVRFRDTY